MTASAGILLIKNEIDSNNGAHFVVLSVKDAKGIELIRLTMDGGQFNKTLARPGNETVDCAIEVL